MRLSLFSLLILLSSFSIFAQADTKVFIQDVSWSPDGKYLGYTGLHDYVKEKDSFKTDIYIIRADGSDQKRITDESRNGYYTSMSKKRVAYSAGVAGTKDSEIYTANHDGSDIRQVTKNNGRNTTPAFSPDGKKIAFISTRDTAKHQIYIMNADGSNITRLTRDDAVGYYNPQWSPDGKRLVYYSEKGDQKDQIWTMNADGSNQTLLTGNLGHNIFPGWSPNGKQIIFSSSKRGTDASGSYVDGSFLYVMNADGSALAKVGNIQSFFARFSPDGKSIAYVSGRFPVSSIFIANADGSGARKITK
jgi:TolB protein